jgi:hypothetical protein
MVAGGKEGRRRSRMVMEMSRKEWKRGIGLRLERSIIIIVRYEETEN